jgi:hypothetical protein
VLTDETGVIARDARDEQGAGLLCSRSEDGGLAGQEVPGQDDHQKHRDESCFRRGVGERGGAVIVIMTMGTTRSLLRLTTPSASAIAKLAPATAAGRVIAKSRPRRVGRRKPTPPTRPPAGLPGW